MKDKENKLETLDELYEKAQSLNDDYDWLEGLHTNKDCWEKTGCPMRTEICNFSDDDGYNESRGNTFDLSEVSETVQTKCLTVDRVELTEEGTDNPYHECTWDIDVEMFVYRDYIYTISNEYIHDAVTFNCQSITRRPLTIDYRK
tara:strand:- start:444 stop:878 length:435 start_codon:yes stop_codon:yes gene_type:complete